MNILAVSHEFPPIGGGGANACRFLTKGFVEKGHSVTLVTAMFDGLASEEVIDGVNIIRVNAKRSRVEQCSFKEMLSYLTKAYPVANALCKNQKFDVCLVFFGIPAGPIGYLLKKIYKIPYVIRFGGGDIPGFQDRFTKVYKIIAPSIKAIWKNANRRIANSQGLKDMAYDFCDRYPFDVVCNGVDTAMFCPLLSTLNDVDNDDNKDKVNLLFVSRLIERKGLQHVLPQLTVIPEVELTIVGDGPYRETLERIVEENKLVDRVTFVGQKNKDEIVAYYQSADIFILPSSKEGMPNVVLEAMACGLPIIMTACQGSTELVDDDNGIITEADQFGNAIKKMIDNPELIRTMSINSRKKAEEKFSWNTVVDSYIDIMESVKQ